MKANIVRIGNSRGIRLPKAVIEQCGFGRSVEIEVRDGRLSIMPVRGAREGWDAAFAEMRARGDDGLIDGEQAGSSWDDAEWRW